MALPLRQLYRAFICENIVPVGRVKADPAEHKIMSWLAPVKLSGKIYFCSDKKRMPQPIHYIITLNKVPRPLGNTQSAHIQCKKHGIHSTAAMFSNINIITLFACRYRFCCTIFIQA